MNSGCFGATKLPYIPRPSLSLRTVSLLGLCVRLPLLTIGLVAHEASVYDQPNDTAGAFTRGGTAFFSILFLGWLQLSELLKAVSGRVVIARHRDYAFYRPRYAVFPV